MNLSKREFLQVLGAGTVQGMGSMAELSRMDNPSIRPFFDGARGRAAQQIEVASSKPK